VTRLARRQKTASIKRRKADDRRWREAIEDQSCPECGCMLLVGEGCGDDICRPAYVTASGDLMCNRCGRRHDEAGEQQNDGDSDFFDPYERLGP
jgi:hypothetical protein